MPRDINVGKIANRNKFIQEQEDKAPRRKVVKVQQPAKRRGTLFAKRNKRLAIREAALRTDRSGAPRPLQIIITYKKTTTNETKKYIVAPYEFAYKRLKVGRKKVLWAYDMDAKHIKSFVFSNVSKVAITDRTFKPKWKIKID